MEQIDLYILGLKCFSENRTARTERVMNTTYRTSNSSRILGLGNAYSAFYMPSTVNIAERAFFNDYFKITEMPINK